MNSFYTSATHGAVCSRISVLFVGNGGAKWFQDGESGWARHLFSGQGGNIHSNKIYFNNMYLT